MARAALILLGPAVMCCRARQRLGEEGEAAFAEAAQCVAGVGVDIEDVAVGGLADRDADADSGPTVAGSARRGRPWAQAGCRSGRT